MNQPNPINWKLPWPLLCPRAVTFGCSSPLPPNRRCVPGARRSPADGPSSFLWWSTPVRSHPPFGALHSANVSISPAAVAAACESKCCAGVYQAAPLEKGGGVSSIVAGSRLAAAGARRSHRDDLCRGSLCNKMFKACQHRSLPARCDRSVVTDLCLVSLCRLFERGHVLVLKLPAWRTLRQFSYLESELLIVNSVTTVNISWRRMKCFFLAWVVCFNLKELRRRRTFYNSPFARREGRKDIFRQRRQSGKL